MFDSVDPIWVLSASVFGVALIVADTAYQIFFATDRRRRINRRLAALDGPGKRADVVTRLRRERGLSSDVLALLRLTWLRRLVVQSGVTIGLRATIGGALALGAAAGLALSIWFDLWIALAGGAVGGVVLPLLILRFLRGRRQRRFAEQFAEAIDIIVRSLRAGHPIAAAIKMAAREMPDPIGTEFGMVEDEITFGLDLESAMRNLQERVGQDDLPLFVTSISIQTQSGGNLTEILANLSETIRQRAKLKRKVRALSAEGRISAIILGVVPFVLFGVLNLIAPEFYGAHWHHPWIRIGLSSAGVWMAIGFVIMHKMINFRA